MSKLRDYVKKHAQCMEISEEEAYKHKIVKFYADYLNEENVDKCEKKLNQIKKSTTIIACGVAEDCES